MSAPEHHPQRKQARAKSLDRKASRIVSLRGALFAPKQSPSNPGIASLRSQ